MESPVINVLVSSFPGLGLPKTLGLAISSSTTVSQFYYHLSHYLPTLDESLIITTTSNKQLSRSSSSALSDYLSRPDDGILPLRLSARMCGGKGGFGSQLRAAGGRMSSRKKRNQGDNNASSRNLDGRRIRTVTEAKSLAEYLTVKPEMEKKEKEARRKRWEEVIELAEKRQEEAKSGAKEKLDAKWVEDKEEAEERTREAVITAIKAGTFTDNLSRQAHSAESSAGSSPVSSTGTDAPSSQRTTPLSSQIGDRRPVSKFVGFDEEDDEFMSD